MIVRIESWGAWIKLESTAALVAVDREGVRALGLDGGDAWTDPPKPSAPVEVHVAVTARCGAGCRGCYIDARADGHEPSRNDLERRLDALGEAGVFTVAFGGGEPTTRDDLDALAALARARGMTPVLTTSGLGLTAARAEKLRAFDQVNVSYDGSREAYADVRGFEGSAAAERAIERLAEAGIRVGINVVLTKSTFSSLRDTLIRARSLGAREAQLLRYKPAGRAASLDYLSRRLSPEQGLALAPLLRALSRELCDGDFRLRIDCSLVPFLSTDEELTADPARLAKHGLMGCEAGGALAAVTVDGRVAPCSFAPATRLATTDLMRAGVHDHELTRWRTWADAPPEPCASCPIRGVCKGGCKVVATHLEGELGPDPECPRVVAHRSRARATAQDGAP